MVYCDAAGLLPIHLDMQEEHQRLACLYHYDILDTDPETGFDDLVRLAAQICQTPAALISFVDVDRQWFKATVGWTGIETPRDIAFCHHAIAQPYFFEVSDALLDERFRSNPLVTKAPHIRFYAAVPLIAPDGSAIGTLCVIDYQARQLTESQQDALWALGRQVMTQLELRLALERLNKESSSSQEGLLLRLAGQIRNSLDLDEILSTTVQEIQKLYQVDRCNFLWCMSIENVPNLLVSHEACTSTAKSWLTQDFSQLSLLAQKISDLEVIRVDDISALYAQKPELYQILGTLDTASLLLLSVHTKSGQIGAIACSYTHKTHQWTHREQEILRAVVDQTAIAIEQAELYAKTRASALAAETQAQQLSHVLQNLRQAQSQLIQTEKMSSLGQMVAGIAHEINNPVNFINGNIIYAQEYFHDLLNLLNLYQTYYPEPCAAIQKQNKDIDVEFLVEDLQKLLQSMKVGAERIGDIVRSLRNFSRLDEAERKPVDIHEGIDSTLLILHNRIKNRGPGTGIAILKDYADLPDVECYPSQLNQVFMNILSNAIDALEEQPSPRQITIKTELAAAEEPGSPRMVTISLRDNGSGMPEAVRKHIFDPFFTTKPIGKGTGLGLSISYQVIVDRHHGTVHCESAEGQGTEFIVSIPVSVND